MTPSRTRRQNGKTGRGLSGQMSSKALKRGIGSRSRRHPTGAGHSADSRSIRLQKYLADLGLGSRRRIESWIVAGRISVDGKVAELGQKVTRCSSILLDGKSIGGRPSHMRAFRIIAYNKPEGEICSREDPANRPTVFQRLPRLHHARWVAVGRLDLNTRGLLLFTDHGELANRLMHPEAGLEREYLCRVFGKVDENTLDTLRQGVWLDRHCVRFHRVSRHRGDGSNTWFRVVVMEGRYREVRRLWEAVGCRVSRLIRVRYGPVHLKRGLPPGRWTELSRAEVNEMVQLAVTAGIHLPGT